MNESHHRRSFWRALREHATHWVIGGILITATGFAPEEWFARTVERLHIPENTLHLWGSGIDLRIIPICLGVACIVGNVLWRSKRKPVPTPSHTAGAMPAQQTPALALPDKPSIAVLAFNNLSDHPNQEYFSDGIAEDIITELSRTRWLFVIARNSSFTYKGHAVDVKQVARELGVRYVLEGSVRRGGERVRVTAQLIDAKAGGHVWADRYDRALADVFAVQDEITTAVTHAIAPAIAQAEQRRAMRKPPENLDAWEAYQRGLWHLAKGSKSDLAEARGFIRRATELDPTFAAAQATLAHVCIEVVVFDDPNATLRELAAAEAHARQALDLDADESGALAVLGWAEACRGHYAEGLELIEHALAVNPNDVGAYLAKGRALIFTGQARAAQEPLMTALRLSPRDPLIPRVLASIAIAHYFTGEYAEAASAAQRAIRDYPEYPLTYRWLTASLGQLGRTEEAGQALHRAQTISRASFDFFVRSRPPWFRPQDHEHMLDGLRKAGWKG